MDNCSQNTPYTGTEDLVASYLNMLRKFHLTEQGEKVLQGYFRYLLQSKIRQIPYHFLIQAETDSLAGRFVDQLLEVVEEIKQKKLARTHFTEYQFLDGFQKEKHDGSDATIIEKCLTNAEYYPTDDDPSDVKRRKSYYDAWWDVFMKYYNSASDKLFIMYGPKHILQGRVKANTKLYNLFFKNKITLGNMDESEIVDGFLKKMKRSGIQSSISFENQLREYVDTIYPKADLRNEEFIDDLFNWMETLSFQENAEWQAFGEDSIPFYHRNESFENIDNEFSQLVGLEEVKETFKNIGRLCSTLPKDTEKRPYLHMVFKGNSGTGKTTVARFVAKLLSSMRIIRKNHVEEVMTSDLLGQYIGQTGPKVERVLQRAEGGVLFIDEAYLLDPYASKSGVNTYREECIGLLLKAMENRSDPVVIFAGYPKEMDEFLKGNPGLKSRIGYQLEFKDYDNDQLLEIFKSMCRRADYEYDEETLDAVQRKLVAERYEESFGNARTVENIFNAAVIESLRSDSESRKISAEHIVIGHDLRSFDELQNELDYMVAAKNAKRIIHELVLSNRFSKEQDKQLPFSNNMIFVGNAGTGKTTTAKLFSEMLFSIGAAKSPRTKMISAQDLYVTNVSEKLKDICKEVMGGVLFIDEIYMLRSYPSYCAEVVSVLLELLEDKKDELIVILAGYKKQMDKFLDENQGLHSRFPITIHFADFTEDELCEIFEQYCSEVNMTVSPEGMKRFREVIGKEMHKDNFGNARTVRNIYEQAFRRHAVAFYENESIDPDVLGAEDIDELVDINDNKPVFGFKKQG